MKAIKRPRFRQFFALHSNTVVANDSVVVKERVDQKAENIEYKV